MVNPGEFIGGAVLGTTFSGVHEGLKELIGKNLIFKSLFKDIKSSLDSLKPLIEQIEECNNELLYCSKEELQDLGQVIQEGKELVVKCLKISRWKVFTKYKYANKLLGWDENLKRQLEMLKVQNVRDGKKTAVAVQHMQVSLMNIQKNTLNQSAKTTKVLELPPLPRLIVGLDVPLKELKAKLLEDDEVSMLVLTAPGGCGKTTLATKFCQDQEVKDKFQDNIIFVTVSQKGNLDLIVQRLCEHKGSLVPAFQNEVHVVQWLQTFFKEERRNPLLLVLDDVWSGSESILENFQFEMPDNNKILVTSRSEFPRFGSSYHLQLLDDDNAMKLFRHSASLGDKISHIFEELSRKIVKRCNGFPLAITVVGRSLCRQPVEIWRKRVIEWSKGSSILDFETKLLLCLQSSLDALDKEMATMKECFLDLGLFPEDYKIPVTVLIDIWGELYDLDEDEDNICFANVYELSNRSLANLVDERTQKVEGEEYYNEHFVTQHDLLRELAIYQAKLDPIEHRRRLFIEICGNNLPKWWREQKNQPMKARVLSISTDRDFSMKWPNMELPEVEVLILKFQTENYALPEFVEKMEKLKVLIVTNICYINPNSKHTELSNFELLGSLSNLKRIRLEGISICSLNKKPTQLKSLQKISFCKCGFGQTYGDFHFNISYAFPNLEEINIDNCGHCGDLPSELGDLIHLKKLSIINIRSLYALPKGMGNLVNLQVLRIRGGVHISKLPGSIKNLKKLNFLDISECFQLKKLPEHIGEMTSLRKLDMRKCYEVRKLPRSVLDLDQLEEVLCNNSTEKLWKPFIPALKSIRMVNTYYDVFDEEISDDETFLY